MRYFTHLKLRKKVRFSFGVLIVLIAINAVVSALAAYSTVQQIVHRENVEQIVNEIHQVRLMVSRYVNTLSRDSAQQVFRQVDTIRRHIEVANLNVNSPHLKDMPLLLDDFTLQFQKYVVGTDQEAAVRSRAADLGQRLLAQLKEARTSQNVGLNQRAYDAVMAQMLAIQWQGTRPDLRASSLDQIGAIRKSLAQLQAQNQGAGGSQDVQLVNFRMLRDANDYLAALEAFERYQGINVHTEKTLIDISDTIQLGCSSVGVEVQALILGRIYATILGVMLTFLLSILSASVLNRYLTREILRPILDLVKTTQTIANGNLSTRITVLVDDEIGELSHSFNRMSESLETSQLKLVERNQSLVEAHQDLEQRVKERTQELAARELIGRQILDAAPVGIFLVDMAGRITQANLCMVDMFGYPLEELIGKEYVALVEPSELEMRRQKMLALMNSEIAIVDLDRRFMRASGVEFWAHLTGKLLRGVGGEKLGLVGVIADITQRKQAQEMLQLAASVFTHAREGIMITDANGTIVDVNDTFVSITGYRREEALGRTPRLLKSDRQTPEFYEGLWQSLIANGNWSGEIWNKRKNGEVFAEMQTISVVRDDAGKPLNYVALFSDITTMKEHQKQLEHIAHFDALTTLPNRLLLADRLQQAMMQSQRRQNSLALVYLDLDGFKVINDTHGHDAGDRVLVMLSQRMRSALREGDTLARIGGDEFVALLVDLTHPGDWEPLLARLLQTAGSPMLIATKTGTVELQVSASAGVTLYPQDNTDADLLMRHADQAMYVAKQSGKNRFHLFDLAHDEAIKTQNENLTQIRRAIDQQEFVLFYQPKVNLATGQVTGAEALIRWCHPERGLLAPAQFLPVIENDPLSIDVGEWVISSALAQMSAWNKLGLALPVSVNMGARQLQMQDFSARLKALLAAHSDVPAHWLQLEVLETSALEDMSQVGSAMNACRAVGVGFALDDFGTGYSSLSYLKHLPAETLKIDQSFVRDMLTDANDLAIVNGVIGLAKAFGRQVIAEGVETQAHGQLLVSVGCELAQGYGIARPMPAEDFPAWVRQWHSGAVWSA